MGAAPHPLGARAFKGECGISRSTFCAPRVLSPGTGALELNRVGCRDCKGDCQLPALTVGGAGEPPATWRGVAQGPWWSEGVPVCLSRAALEEDAYRRIKLVLRWYLSGFYKKPKVRRGWGRGLAQCPPTLPEPHMAPGTEMGDRL